MSRDYYAVLEIGVGASPTQVKRAYQRLARRYSPDVNLWDRDARSLFEEIVEAYRVLSDPTARGVYDRQGGQSRPPPERLPRSPSSVSRPAAPVAVRAAAPTRLLHVARIAQGWARYGASRGRGPQRSPVLPVAAPASA